MPVRAVNQGTHASSTASSAIEQLREDAGEPVAAGTGRGRAALASKGPGGVWCKLSVAQLRELEAVLEAATALGHPIAPGSYLPRPANPARRPRRMPGVGARLDPVRRPVASVTRIDDETAEWVRLLAGTGPEREAAVGRLHAILVRIARAEVARRGPRLRISGPELDDLAYQSAAGALLAITGKIG